MNKSCEVTHGLIQSVAEMLDAHVMETGGITEIDESVIIRGGGSSDRGPSGLAPIDADLAALISRSYDLVFELNAISSVVDAFSPELKKAIRRVKDALTEINKRR